jgi:ABC-type multidrug transport system permease subunit
VLTDFLRRKLLALYRRYSERLITSCGMARKLGSIPLSVHALFGRLDDDFEKYMCVGVAVSCFFFQASSLTSTALIGDRVDGIWNRTLVAGTQPLELILSHVLSCSLLMLVQGAQYFLLLVFYFRDNPNANMPLAACLFLWIGLCGLVYGLSVSVFADSCSIALFLSTIVFIPVLGIAGEIFV